MSNLKQKTILNILWSIIEQVSVQFLLIVTSIILGRLLEPSDFGILGMITIFSSIAQSIVYSGFGSALIQKKNVSQKDASSVFYFNIFMGLILSAILFLSAPLIAGFFDQTILVPLTRAMSVNLLINSFSLVQRSLMMKNLNFKLHLKIELIAVFLSGILGIISALLNMGVWSLAIQLISRYLINTILLWILSDWQPSLIFSVNSIKSMFPFGSRLLVSGIINTIFNNIYQTFIGKIYSASELGFYTKALTFETSAVNTTAQPFSKVIFATLSSFQDNNEILKRSYRKTIRLGMFLHFPMMVGIITISDPLIRFLLTDKWASSISYLQLLCFVGLLMPLDYYSNVLLKIKGRSDLYLRLEIIKKIIIIILIIITYRWSIKALLIGQIINSIIAVLIDSIYTKKFIGYSLFEQIKDIISSLLITAIMGGCILLLSNVEFNSLFIELIVLIVTGIVLYTGINVLIKSPEIKEIWQTIKNIAQSIKKRDSKINIQDN